MLRLSINTPCAAAGGWALRHRYTGGQGIYTHTVSYEKDPDCPICSAGVVIKVDAGATLQQVGMESGL
jgi:carbohydrate-selective porin OprB